MSKAWSSNEAYYRKKYAGVARIKALFSWLRFVLSDVIWGNGESAAHLIRTALVIVLIVAGLDTLLTRGTQC